MINSMSEKLQMAANISADDIISLRACNQEESDGASSLTGLID